MGLWLLPLGLAVACQRSPQPEALATADCMAVEHIAGTACVPNEIQRMVTLDGVTFEYAIAAGLSPIATAGQGLMDHMAEQLAGVENVSQTGEPNLEQVLALSPDLIVGLDSNQVAYAQATQIAPTVLFKFEHSGQWKTSFQQFAEALGQADVAQQTMANYDARTADFRARMGIGKVSPKENRPNDLQVSVVRIYPETINLYLRDSFVGTVLQDAGLSRPTAQNIGADEAAALFGNPIQTSISRELLNQAEGDVIFLWTGENTAELAETAQQKLESLQQDPLWQQLKAVQTGRVYRVPSYWIGSGPIAANAILDDLFKYLVKDS
ncbi:iron-siderophore ABC transporter substrate-binding protein [Leptothoe sp. PORK10 BA2]|uniref:iron-siderophore ABC transporter substrate-binding protein n=1 Tax=Leptothoe sp. PORK10 BA2 TaxID=3110254 RepID=UPI002B213208|nr:iron-siderophore ABC transporter substrate-binding protein [Leptothoe sp. PORK10 BA2]MEA5466683.1 iron-siderophore ABC transporter substrate-binding protein [Leptothoe sp. PORK10 BA2]